MIKIDKHINKYDIFRLCMTISVSSSSSSPSSSSFHHNHHGWPASTPSHHPTAVGQQDQRHFSQRGPLGQPSGVKASGHKAHSSVEKCQAPFDPTALPICSMSAIFTYITGWFLGQILVNIPYMEHMGLWFRGIFVSSSSVWFFVPNVKEHFEVQKPNCEKGY